MPAPKTQAKFFILMTPYHANMGDQAILISEIKYIKDKYKGKPIKYLSTTDVPKPAYALKSVINDNDIIFLHGGGNMGSIWQGEEEVRLEIIKAFPNNKIISFPQSAFYLNDKDGIDLLKKSSDIYNSHKNLHLFARETASYEIMKHNFPKCNVYLAPDMVLYLDPLDVNNDRDGILLCMRNDHERALDIEHLRMIENLAKSKSDSVRVLDTVFDPKELDGLELDVFLNGLLKLYNRHKLIITDRLHGMVFAALSSTPCIVFPNSYHKVAGLYQWIKHNDFIRFCNPDDDISSIMDELLALDNTRFSNAEFIDRFDIISEVIDMPLHASISFTALAQNPVSKKLSAFLSSSYKALEGLDELSYEAATTLYAELSKNARLASENITSIDPELRVQLCDAQDRVLERIVDLLPDDFALDTQCKPKAVFAPSLARTVDTDLPLVVNSYLLKEFGVSVYLLAKHFDARPVMYYGSNKGEYPFLSVIPGMELLTLDPELLIAKNAEMGINEPNVEYNPCTYLLAKRSAFIDAYLEHLRENYQQMDVLILYGLYPRSLEFLEEYRRLRPDGKVYCGLDMNSYWMNSVIPWSAETIAKFISQCDVIATSAKSIRDAINRRTDVSVQCRWLTNGFYNPAHAQVVADADVKENIILTVGRIGTEQKNNQELIYAFIRIADKLPNWKLRLVGPIESRMDNFIADFYKHYPRLKSRVTFTGPIYDKQKLFDEYAKAKVFVLTSLIEGFPNVYAEALAHGCKFVTSSIDAASDMINSGELGEVYPIRDQRALQKALLKVCRSSDNFRMQQHMTKARAYFERYYNWERNIKKLIYMLYG